MFSQQIISTNLKQKEPPSNWHSVPQPTVQHSTSKEHTLPFPSLHPEIPFPPMMKTSRPPAWLPVHPVCVLGPSKQSSSHIFLGACFPVMRMILLLPEWKNCLWRIRPLGNLRGLTVEMTKLTPDEAWIGVMITHSEPEKQLWGTSLRLPLCPLCFPS